MKKYLLIITLICIPLFLTVVYAQEFYKGKNNAISSNVPDSIEEDFSKMPKHNAFNGENFEELSWKNSVMFHKAELTQLYALLNNYQSPLIHKFAGQKKPLSTKFRNRNSLKSNTNLSSLNSSKQNIVAPTFFLESILYYSPESWSIWLNGKRFRKGNDKSDLIIIKVQEDFVDFIWKSSDLDTISPYWKKTLSLLDNVIIENFHKNNISQHPLREGSFYWNYSNNDKSILLDSSKKAVKFRLNIHQSLITRIMKISEGSQATSIIQAGHINSGKNFVKGATSGSDFDNLLEEIFDDTNVAVSKKSPLIEENQDLIKDVFD